MILIGNGSLRGWLGRTTLPCRGKRSARTVVMDPLHTATQLGDTIVQATKAGENGPRPEIIELAASVAFALCECGQLGEIIPLPVPAAPISRSST